MASAPGVRVAEYCETFAKRYAEIHETPYRDGSAHTSKQSDVMRWASNVFQPAGSRFTAGYDCRFEVGAEATVPVSVSLYLTETQAFAEHTQWEKLQIIPIEHVVDEARGRAGYGVFIYRKIKNRFLTVAMLCRGRKRSEPAFSGGRLEILYGF